MVNYIKICIISIILIEIVKNFLICHKFILELSYITEIFFRIQLNTKFFAKSTKTNYLDLDNLNELANIYIIYLYFL
jgi:hypothetical protein